MKEQEVKVDEVKVDEVKAEKVEKEVKVEVEKENDMKVEETKDEKNEKPEVKTDVFSDIFVTENDTFTVSLKYYKKDGKLFVESIDEKFDDKEMIHEILDVTLKHPDQSDCYNISAVSPRLNSDINGVDVREFIKVEISRFVLLARGWNVNKELNSSSIMQLNPKIIKG